MSGHHQPLRTPENLHSVQRRSGSAAKLSQRAHGVSKGRIQGMAAARSMPDLAARKLSTRTRTGSDNSWPPAMPPHQRVGSTPIRAKTGSHKGKKKFSIP